MADESRHWVDGNNPLAKITYCIVFASFSLRFLVTLIPETAVNVLLEMSERKNPKQTSFWSPCCSKTRKRTTSQVGKRRPSEEHLNATFFSFHWTSAERAPNPDWSACVRRPLTLSQSCRQHWPVPVHPTHAPDGQPAQPTDPLARSSCWHLKKRRKKKETQSVWESLLAPEPTAGPVQRLVLSVLLDTKGKKCKDGSAGGCNRSGHELDEVSGEWRGGVGWKVEGHFTSSLTAVNKRRRFRLIKLP